jgi:phage anti-repressor protein
MIQKQKIYVFIKYFIKMDFKTYLKTYSSINKSFIDDFYEISNPDIETDDFIIDLEQVAKWLKTTKATLKKTLLKSYTENFDYIIKVEQPEQGQKTEKILLTPTCFKRLCMVSRTKKADQVRTYFIQLEKHLDKYKDHIIRQLTNKIAKYEPGLKTGVETPMISNKRLTLKHTKKQYTKTQKKQ